MRVIIRCHLAPCWLVVAEDHGLRAGGVVNGGLHDEYQYVPITSNNNLTKRYKKNQKDTKIPLLSSKPPPFLEAHSIHSRCMSL